jgi:hypothetical protein
MLDATPARSDAPVPLERRKILAIGGHEFSRGTGNEALRDYILGLVDSEGPRVCLVPTASGDPDHQIGAFARSLGAAGSDHSHLSLFRLEGRATPIRDQLLSQDIIYVGGGSLLNLLAIWRAHGLDRIMREAWERGIVLCVHYGRDPERRGAFREAVAFGIPAGYGLDDGAGILFEGTEIAEAVSARPGARVLRVEPSDGARSSETAIPVRELRDPRPALDHPLEELVELRNTRAARIARAP